MDSALRFLLLRDLEGPELPLRRRVVLNQLPLTVTAALLLSGVAVVHPGQLTDARVLKHFLQHLPTEHDTDIIRQAVKAVMAKPALPANLPEAGQVRTRLQKLVWEVQPRRNRWLAVKAEQPLQ